MEKGRKIYPGLKIAVKYDYGTPQGTKKIPAQCKNSPPCSLFFFCGEWNLMLPYSAVQPAYTRFAVLRSRGYIERRGLQGRSEPDMGTELVRKVNL